MRTVRARSGASQAIRVFSTVTPRITPPYFSPAAPSAPGTCRQHGRVSCAVFELQTFLAKIQGATAGELQVKAAATPQANTQSCNMQARHSQVSARCTYIKMFVGHRQLGQSAKVGIISVCAREGQL